MLLALQDRFDNRRERVLQGMWMRAHRESESVMTVRTFSARQIGANILAKIVSHIGQHEEPMGSNSGPNVDPKLQYVGVSLSLPANQKQWCAGEASYDTGHTLDEMGLQALPRLNTASSHEAVNWAIRNHTRQTAQTVVPGDWCILRGGVGECAQDGHAYDHTTVLERIEGGVAHWVAGNTGDAVARGETGLDGVCLLRPYVLPAANAVAAMPESRDVGAQA